MALRLKGYYQLTKMIICRASRPDWAIMGGRAGSSKWLPVAGPVKLKKRDQGLSQNQKRRFGGTKRKIPTELKEKTLAGTRHRAVLLLQENLCHAPMVEERKTRKSRCSSPEGTRVTRQGALEIVIFSSVSLRLHRIRTKSFRR